MRNKVLLKSPNFIAIPIDFQNNGTHGLKFLQSKSVETNSNFFDILQGFPTGVPQRDDRGAAKFKITTFFIDVLLHMMPHIVIYNQLGVPPIFLKILRVPRSKKVEKHWSTIYKFSRL